MGSSCCFLADESECPRAVFARITGDHSGGTFVGFTSRVGSFALAVLAAAATAVLVYYGTGLLPWWPLMWFAPLPVLFYAARSSWWSTALVAFAAWFVGALN